VAGILAPIARGPGFVPLPRAIHQRRGRQHQRDFHQDADDGRERRRRAYAEQRYFLLRLRLFLLCVLVIGLWYAIGTFGLLGAVVVVVSINLFEHLVVTYRSATLIGVKRADLRLLGDVGKLALAAMVGAAGALVARSFVVGLKPFYVLVFTGIVFVVLYIAALLLLRVPNDVERERVRKMTDLERFFFWRRAAEPLT